jgi:hypothetical protein
MKTFDWAILIFIAAPVFVFSAICLLNFIGNMEEEKLEKVERFITLFFGKADRKRQ